MKHHFSFIEPLESRIAPAGLTANVAGHMLKITGDPGADTMTIAVDPGNPTVFDVSDTVNGNTTDYTSPSGITDISVALLSGDDNLTIGKISATTFLLGGLSVTGGAGAKTITVYDLSVAKNISIANGITTGTNTTTLHNLAVSGNLSVKNSGGDSVTFIDSRTAAMASVHGNISIVNGKGVDQTSIEETNIGGNVTVSNGQGDSTGSAGFTVFEDELGGGSRSFIKGNVSVSYISGDGSGANEIADTEIGGNVMFNDGTGNFTTDFTGISSGQPAVIHGNLTMKGGASPMLMEVGASLSSGMEVMKNLTVTGGNAVDTLTFYKLRVDGTTSLSLGNGANSVTIDDSSFAEMFNLTTGKDNDTVNIETTDNNGAPTVFEKAAAIHEGTGDNGTSLAFGVQGTGHEIDFWSTFVVHLGADNPYSYNNVNFVAPFGNHIQWID